MPPRPPNSLRRALTASKRAAFNPQTGQPFSASRAAYSDGRLPLEQVADDARANLGNMYEASRQMGVADESNVGDLNYTPAYLIPQDPENPVQFMDSLGSGLLTMSRTTPAEWTKAMNGREVGERNIQNFLARNRPGQSLPFPIIDPRGLEAHVSRPLYVFRGVDNGEGGIRFRNAWGQADPTLGIAAWNKSEEFAPRGTPGHEMDHLTNQAFPNVRSIHGKPHEILPGGMGTAAGRDAFRRAQGKIYEPVEGLYEESLDFDVDPRIADRDAYNHAFTLERMIGRNGIPDPAGLSELQAIMAQTKREAGQIHGPPVTRKDEIDLFRSLMQEPIPYGQEVPKALHGPKTGDELPFYNDRQRAIQSIHDNSPRDRQELLQELWLKLFSDNSNPQSANYA